MSFSQARRALNMFYHLQKHTSFCRFVSDKTDNFFGKQKNYLWKNFCQSRPKWVRTMWPTRAAVCCWVGVMARLSLLTKDKAMVNGGEPMGRNW